jgi:oxygen-dependent protoporphyrinogen oxidase
MTRAIAALSLRRGPAPFDLDDLAAADDGSTLADWARANLGERAYEYVVRPLMEPLTGADPTKISASFTIALMSQIFRTQLTVPAEGLGSIAKWLTEGIDVRLSTPATSISSTPTGVQVDTPAGIVEGDAVVLAVDLGRAPALLDGVVDGGVLAGLGTVVPIPTYHVLLGYHRDPWPDATPGLVVRAGAGQHHNYGVLLNGRRSPGTVAPGGQTVSVYFDRAQTEGLSDREIVNRARDAVDHAFGPAEPDFERLFALDVGLIAPVPGHYRRMQTLRAAMPDRVRLAGDFLTHSGIEGALRSGERAAQELLDSRLTARQGT